jgi:hypothetical protein
MKFRPWIVRRGEASDESWIEKTLAQNWGGAKVVVNDEIVDLLEHMTLIAGERNGLIIFRLVPNPSCFFSRRSFQTPAWVRLSSMRSSSIFGIWAHRSCPLPPRTIT